MVAGVARLLPLLGVRMRLLFLAFVFAFFTVVVVRRYVFQGRVRVLHFAYLLAARVFFYPPSPPPRVSTPRVQAEGIWPLPVVLLAILLGHARPFQAVHPFRERGKPWPASEPVPAHAPVVRHHWVRLLEYPVAVAVTLPFLEGGRHPMLVVLRVVRRHVPFETRVVGPVGPGLPLGYPQR